MTNTAEHFAADQADSARTPTTRSISGLTTARSLCHAEDTAAQCRGIYRSGHRSVNSIVTDTFSKLKLFLH